MLIWLTIGLVKAFDHHMPNLSPQILDYPSISMAHVLPNMLHAEAKMLKLVSRAHLHLHE